MRGTVSFHPVDTAFFDDLLHPLLVGKKVNPEEYLSRAIKLQTAAWPCARFVRCLEYHMELLAPPPPPTEGKMWERLRARLERFDYRPDPTSVLVSRHIEPDLHLRGRPFLITEGSAIRVAAVVDDYCAARDEAEAEALALEQLARLNAKLGSSIEPQNLHSAATVSMRRDLLGTLTGIYELGRAARRGDRWADPGGTRKPAIQVMEQELPWRAISLHSRAMPFWIADDVDGLETVCAAAGVPPPPFITPAYRLFGELCETYPGLSKSLGTELNSDRDIGAWVAPEDVPELLEFLSQYGSTIIKAATQAGEGTSCTTVLRKIRECAKYSESRNLGYLEASGVPPLGPIFDEG